MASTVCNPHPGDDVFVPRIARAAAHPLHCLGCGQVAVMAYSVRADCTRLLNYAPALQLTRPGHNNVQTRRVGIRLPLSRRRLLTGMRATHRLGCEGAQPILKPTTVLARQSGSRMSEYCSKPRSVRGQPRSMVKRSEAQRSASRLCRLMPCRPRLDTQQPRRAHMHEELEPCKPVKRVMSPNSRSMSCLATPTAICARIDGGLVAFVLSGPGRLKGLGTQ